MVLTRAFGVTLLLANCASSTKTLERGEEATHKMSENPQDDAATSAPVDPDMLRIDKALEGLGSADASVRQNAIKELQTWGAAKNSRHAEIVTALLELLDQNISADRGYEVGYVFHEIPDGHATVVVPAENVSLAEALARSGATSALPLIRKVYAVVMAVPDETREPGSSSSLASSIYSLSAERVACWDPSDGLQPYVPYPIQVEETRMLLRPDLVPVGGLTASLSVVSAAYPDESTILGSAALEIRLVIKNHSERPVKVDLSDGHISFSVVTMVAKNISSRELKYVPSKQARKTSLLPGQSTSVQWRVPVVNTSPLHKMLGTGGSFMKATYEPGGTAVAVVSNSIHSYYFAFE